jgi:hypothetical protein
MSLKAEDRRWESPFARFVASYGVTALAARLSIDPSAVLHWVRGTTQPRTDIAFDICEFTRARGIDLSLEEIYGHSRKPRDWKTRKDHVVRHSDRMWLDTGVIFSTGPAPIFSSPLTFPRKEKVK